jgi:hypothetical protein
VPGASTSLPLKKFSTMHDAVSGLSIKGTQITMYSDAVLVTGESLGPVLAAVQALWFVALGNDLMIRGAIKIWVAAATFVSGLALPIYSSQTWSRTYSLRFRFPRRAARK